MISGFADIAPDPTTINEGLNAEITGFLLRAPTPSSTDVANFLELYEGEERNEAAQALIARGISASNVSKALTWLDNSGKWKAALPKINGVLTVISAAACGFHGYRRNQSIFWSATWFVLGGIFPIITPVVALAQGFGKKS